MSDPNYYEMLEISPDATSEEVREAYRLLTMVWHPDRFPKDSRLWAHANEKMQQINEAYNALKNLQDTDSAPTASTATASTTFTSTTDSSTNTKLTSRHKPVNDQEQQRRVQEQEQQRLEAHKRAEAQQRRITEQRQRAEEQRRQEAEARLNMETEQRRAEAERLRLLMKEAQRVEEIQRQRADRGLCILCGKALSSIEKITRRNRHRDCSVFVDDTTAKDTQHPKPQVQETVSDS